MTEVQTTPVKKKHRRGTKIAVGSLSLAVLLASGGTMALWSANAEAEQGQVASGNLAMTTDPGVWASDSSGVIDDIAAFRVSPGETLTYTQQIDATLEGDNIVGHLEVTGAGANSGFDPAAVSVSEAVLTTMDGQPLSPVLTESTEVLATTTFAFSEDPGTTVSGAQYDFSGIGYLLRQGSGGTEASYVVEDGNLVIDSPLVGDLSSDLQATVTGAGTVVHGVVGTEGLLGSTVEGLAQEINIPLVANLDLSGGTVGANGLDSTLQEASATLLAEPVEDANQLVSINLADGTIKVDLAQVVGGTDGGLTEGDVQLINDAIAEALGTLDDKVDETLTKVINKTEVAIELPLKLELDGGLIPATNGHVYVNGTLGQFAGTVEGRPEITLDIDLLGLPVGTVLNPIVDFLDDALLAPLAAGLGSVLSLGVDEMGEVVTDSVDPLLATLNPILTEVDITVNE